MLFLILIIFIALGIWFFLQQPQFGKVPAAARLERIRKASNYREGTFHNLSATPVMSEDVSMWKAFVDFLKPGKDRQPDKPLPSVHTNLKTLPTDEPVLVWFGHSSYLLIVAGRKILVDPVFSGHASPVSFFGKNYPGSNIYSVDDMPEIDVLLLTHDHYDHLDYPTINRLRPKVKQVVTSLGVGAHLEGWGYDPGMIQELAWHEDVTVAGVLNFTAWPARHFSGRLFKRGQTLWSSFVLQTPGHAFYLGGDSGYDTHFKEIGDQYGPFDLAILECGQYNDNWRYIHMMPEQTAQAAVDLRAKMLLPVHWGKFTLALHPWYEPIERVTAKAGELKVPLVTPRIGEPLLLSGPPLTAPWWR
ncbi:MBL fold metallo-hydrolase [Salmonirosea aquatica]|uniref:MBL fold metallo-hydrolase n=1 Tax=Salmonirosea aquatica TaxID=2654236 RepID=A0A7C9BL25_9BACT|nr:MBL fold metallo-hydrolase [Cytophagaceae bacterium SJW1-29]